MAADAKTTESKPDGRVGIKGEATKDGYIEKYGLAPEKCIQGSATTDDELCDFLQGNIEKEGLQCIVVISSKSSHAYRLPSEQASETGIAILGELLMTNLQTLRVFHLNRQKLDSDRAPIVTQSLAGCTALEVVDFYDNGLTNDTCKALWDVLKVIPTMKEVEYMTCIPSIYRIVCKHVLLFVHCLQINFGNNDDVNHEAREVINEEAKEYNGGITVVF